MPASDGGDDFVRISGPGEWLRLFVVLAEESVDGGLEIDDRTEHAALQSPLCQLGEEAFDGVEPRARGRREMESEALMPVKPMAHLGMLVGGVIVEDHVHDLASWDLRLDGVEEADELLMPVTLHVAADDRAVEDVEGGEERGRSVPLVIVRHGSSAASLQRQAGLGAVERLNLALLVDAEDDGVSGRIDVETHDVAQFVDELWIVRELELARPVRLEAVRAPNALNGADGDASGLRHHRPGPVRRLSGRVFQRQRDDPFGDFGAKRLDAGRPRLVAKQAAEAFLHETLLPAPDAGLRFAGPAHDLVRADAIGAEQDDFSAPGVLLSGVAVPDERFEPAAIRNRYCDGYSGAHAEDSHAQQSAGIPKRTQPSDFIH